MEVITAFINNVGFPIVISLALFYQMSKSQTSYLKTLDEFKVIIQNNTSSITHMNEAVKEMKNIVRELRLDREQREKSDS